MQNNQNESLITITRSSGIILIGTAVSLFLSFIIRPILARYVTESEYGIYSLAITVINIVCVIATLGLDQGVARNIAFSRGQNNTIKVNRFIYTSILFALFTSIVLSLILFLTAGFLAENIFHEPGIKSGLKILSTAIPFTVLIGVMISVFRGFDQAKPSVFFNNILRQTLFLPLLLAVILLNLSLIGVFYAYLISFIVTCSLLLIYTVKRLHLPIKLPFDLKHNSVAKELLFFSLPLFGVAVIDMINSWADTILLGYFSNSTSVGLYSVASSLAQLVFIPLQSMRFIYVPVISGLFARKLIPEIRGNLSIVTRWICSASLPLFLALFLFPETAISLLFGTNYAPASETLRILCLRGLIVNVMGLNDGTLIAMGDVRFVMWTVIATAVVSVGLNLALIPRFDIIGAAIASALTATFIKVVLQARLQMLHKIQPFSKNLLKPVVAFMACVFIIRLAFGNLAVDSWWELSIVLVFFYCLYVLAIILTRSFEKEDIAMLHAIGRRLGIRIGRIKEN